MSNLKKQYNWSEIQEYYDQGHTIIDTRKRFGFSIESWYKAIRRGDLLAKQEEDQLEVTKAILSGKIKRVSRYNVKQRIIKHNILPYCCSICGISEWQGKILSLHLDHINGVNDDDRLENLRFLCPNCHSLTDTYAGKAKGNGRYNRAKIKNHTRGSKQ